ncbi:MAG TPA: 50S ribosomal protein L5, partial [Thermodesulforhabdus norvegica]|nr:50S ribosomal protein L5 [Thermodesulforhabdus norvegica]
MMSRLRQVYFDEIRPMLMERFRYKSPMQVPRLEKIVLNMGVGEATTNSEAIDEAVEILTLISGQKPLINKAKKAISGFKVREGMDIG